MSLGLESLRAHLSPWIWFRYDTKLYIVVRGDSEPIPNTWNSKWQSMKFYLISAVTFSIPHFDNTAYIKYALPAEQPVLEALALSIQFRPQSPDGLLLYGTQANIMGDFFALSMKAGRVEFEYNLGEFLFLQVLYYYYRP